MFKPLAIACTFISFAVNAGINDKNFGALQVQSVTSIYDGDTFRANIKGVHPVIGERMSIRVAGIDTPEIRGKCPKEKALARKAKMETVSFLRNAKRIELRNIKRGKYFRIVADVYADNRSLTESLAAKGLGVRYNGGSKSKNWCL